VADGRSPARLAAASRPRFGPFGPHLGALLLPRGGLAESAGWVVAALYASQLQRASLGTAGTVWARCIFGGTSGQLPRRLLRLISPARLRCCYHVVPFFPFRPRVHSETAGMASRSWWRMLVGGSWVEHSESSRVVVLGIGRNPCSHARRSDVPRETLEVVQAATTSASLPC
jgi:hypothetical protein